MHFQGRQLCNVSFVPKKGVYCKRKEFIPTENILLFSERTFSMQYSKQELMNIVFLVKNHGGGKSRVFSHLHIMGLLTEAARLLSFPFPLRKQSVIDLWNSKLTRKKAIKFRFHVLHVLCCSIKQFGNYLERHIDHLYSDLYQLQVNIPFYLTIKGSTLFFSVYPTVSF